VNELPDPPDNFDFLELFTPQQQDEIDRRFQSGIRYHEDELACVRHRATRSERMAFERRERRALARKAMLPWAP
jgi:hypothetical protein